jgi:hypothetical protein
MTYLPILVCELNEQHNRRFPVFLTQLLIRPKREASPPNRKSSLYRMHSFRLIPGGMASLS